MNDSVFRLVDGRHFGTLDLLGGLESGRYSGGKRRFYCPIHGGDHQRSLSITEDGELAGVGYCHSCHATVIIENWPGREERPHRQRLSTAQRLVQPIPVKQRTAITPDPDLLALREKAERMQRLIEQDRAQEYLAGRGLDADIIARAEIGYIPTNARLTNIKGKWADRLMFPLWSPDGIGYAGRALWGWQPGMDEDAHKSLLDAYSDACDQQHKPNDHRRWEKTNIAGWYGPSANELAEAIIIVEGPLDRLALLSCADPCDVVAAVGTAFQHEWLPRHVRYAVLAYDGDDSGQERAQAKARDMRLAGIEVTIATPPADGHGKDPSARYRLADLGYIWQAFDRLKGYGREIPTDATPAPLPPAPIIPAPVATSGGSYSQRVHRLMAQGMDYISACAQVTRENLENLGGASDG